MTRRTSLDKMRLFEGGVITEINCEGAASQQLMAMGMLPGKRITIVQKAPWGDPITVESDRQRLSLRLADACSVGVESEES